MEQLIEALNIFLKYGNPTYPTHCEHDILAVVDYSKSDIPKADRKRLKELGFFWSNEDEAFISYRYGSA
jgi:hypothetical protein